MTRDTASRCFRTGVWVLLSATACAVGPDYKGPPEIEAPAVWNGELQGGLTAEERDPGSLARWWEGLDDPTLNDLIEGAVAANLDLRVAESQLRQARSQRALAGANRFPTLGARASATQGGTVNGNGPSSSSELYSGGFDSSWEVDVFGGQARSVEAGQADMRAAEEARRDVLVSILSEVALNYVELRSFQQQHAVARGNLELQEETLAIVQAQFDSGAAAGLALEQAISNAATTGASIPTLEQNINQTKNRLTLLLGGVPGSRDAELDPVRPVPVPPIEVAVGVPADILRRRPDIRGAERRFAAETARLGVATAELYPKFFLNGSVGVESVSAAGVSGLFSSGPEMRWTVFDAGSTRRQIEIQDAVQEQAMIEYERAVLTALGEVENAMNAFVQEQIRLKSLRESADAASRAASIASSRYDAGISTFIEVLDAQRTALTAQDSVASSSGAVTSNLIRLYKALGGGWSAFEEAGSEE